MSTRGCVAIGNTDKWEGVYNHFDSYPQGLGKLVYDHIKGRDAVDLSKFAAELLKYDDWRNYLAGGKCKYCGQTGFGQPHSISGQIFLCDKTPETTEDYEVLRNIKTTGYPDPLAKWHKHGHKDRHLTQVDCDPLFIEWVYIINVEALKMIVLTHGRAEGKHKETSFDGQRTWMSPNYTHYFVCAIDLFDEREPDWDWISATGNKISEEAYNKYDKED